MPYETDTRLKSYLDTNQLHREQLCLAVLALDSRFTEVRPRHPRGGPDGGRDIEAIFKKEQSTFGAVGFINGANDSDEHKKQIKSKFKDDLAAALKATPKPAVFVFLTNVSLTLGEKNELIAHAKAADVSHAEIFDREIIRIALDAPDGFSIRFQYLNIPLSSEEQSSFFAKWGDGIQSLVTHGFQRLEATLDRILFLQESSDILPVLHIQLELDRAYPATEIGHFRAFCSLALHEPKHTIFQILFGSSDRAHRFYKVPQARDEAGIAEGISGGQWETYFPDDADAQNNEGQESETKEKEETESASDKYHSCGTSSSVGIDPVHFIVLSYRHDDSLIRWRPRIQVRDLHGSHFLIMLNRSLAEKLKAFHLYAAGYKIDEIQKSNFMIDDTPFDFPISDAFDQAELADPWVRLRPLQASAFHIDFWSKTPLRLFSSPKTPDSLAKSR